MSFEAEIKHFLQTHPFSQMMVDGILTKYLLCGKQDAKYTLVYLVGGTGISAVWFQHILKMEADYRILTMDYPMEITTNEKLAAQKDLIDSMPRAKIERVNGGHTATLFKVEEYVAATRRFIENLEETPAG